MFVFTFADSETAGAVKHYERRQRAYLSIRDTTPLIHREKCKTNRLHFYIAVFLRFSNPRH